MFYNLLSDNAGKILKRERKAWGMSRKRLARLTNIEPEVIEDIEKGYVCMMNYDMLIRFCKVLEISPFIFFIRKLTNEEILEIIK